MRGHCPHIQVDGVTDVKVGSGLGQVRNCSILGMYQAPSRLVVYPVSRWYLPPGLISSPTLPSQLCDWHDTTRIGHALVTSSPRPSGRLSHQPELSTTHHIVHLSTADASREDRVFAAIMFNNNTCPSDGHRVLIDETVQTRRAGASRAVCHEMRCRSSTYYRLFLPTLVLQRSPHCNLPCSPERLQSSPPSSVAVP